MKRKESTGMQPGITMFLILLAAFVAGAREAVLSMVHTNALGEEHPFAMFRGKAWKPAPGTRYVKLHLHFDETIPVRGMEIDDCGSGLNPEISVFFNFDQWILRTDSALGGSIPEALYPKRKGGVLVLEGFEETLEVRSLTVNFEANSGFQLCDLRLRDPAGAAYSIKVPEVVSGTAEASSILGPAAAYDPILLFDSRFEHGWATRGEDKGATLTFQFDQPRKIGKRFALVYRNPTDSLRYFFAAPHLVHPVEHSLGFKYKCLCVNHAFKVGAGETWYRIVEFRLAKEFVGNEIAVTHSLIGISAGRAAAFSQEPVDPDL